MSNVLISIKPKYVNLILAHKKQIEVRRRGCSFRPGDRLVIYSSSPDRQVVATCEVDRIFIQEPLSFARRFASSACVTPQELRKYLAGAPQGVAIGMRKVRRLPEPLPLRLLRHQRPHFSIPQSYRFLRDEELELITRSRGS